MLAIASAIFGQRGDRPAASNDEEQRPPAFSIPPSPALTPEEALKTFRLAPGFRIEFVAIEPLVEDPVAIAFDADGSIWAVEMRGWMNDVDGAGPLTECHSPTGTLRRGQADRCSARNTCARIAWAGPSCNFSPTHE